MGTDPVSLKKTCYYGGFVNKKKTRSVKLTLQHYCSSRRNSPIIGNHHLMIALVCLLLKIRGTNNVNENGKPGLTRWLENVAILCNCGE